MMDVIIAAAWYAIFRDGYALASPNPSKLLAFGEPAGGICARCRRHRVVLRR